MVLTCRWFLSHFPAPPCIFQVYFIIFYYILFKQLQVQNILGIYPPYISQVYSPYILLYFTCPSTLWPRWRFPSSTPHYSPVTHWKPTGTPQSQRRKCPGWPPMSQHPPGNLSIFRVNMSLRIEHTLRLKKYDEIWHLNIHQLVDDVDFPSYKPPLSSGEK